jgi:hypothetical protein
MEDHVVPWFDEQLADNDPTVKGDVRARRTRWTLFSDSGFTVQAACLSGRDACRDRLV